MEPCKTFTCLFIKQLVIKFKTKMKFLINNKKKEILSFPVDAKYRQSYTVDQKQTVRCFAFCAV